MSAEGSGLRGMLFLEHDHVYTASAHQFLQFASKAIDPLEGCRSNHEVVSGLARRLGAEHRGFDMSPREIIDETLRVSGRGTLAELEAARRLDSQPPFEAAHFLHGFGHADGKFHFRAATGRIRPTPTTASAGRGAACPPCPTIGRSTKARTRPIRSSSRPRRRATSSIRASTRPRPRSPTKAARQRSCVPRGTIRLHVKASPGVIVSEGLWDNRASLDGHGVNTLTSAVRRRGLPRREGLGAGRYGDVRRRRG